MQVSSPSLNKFTYRPEIDGLRALAVLSVIIYHLNNYWLDGGFLGVDIFFVISGFLITSIISKEIRGNRFSFKKFYNKRIKRIYPVFIFTLFLASIFSSLFFIRSESELLRKTIELATVFFSNFYLSYRQGYWDLNATENPILHIWSLAVEEQYYLFFPIFLYVAFKKFKTVKSLLLLTIGLFLFFIIMSFIPDFAYKKFGLYNTYYISTLRFPELLIGSILALAPIKSLSNKINTILSFIAVLGLGLCLVFYKPTLPFLPGIIMLVPCFFTALLIFSMQGDNLVKSFFSLKLNVFIGKISYSLYLFHWLFIAMAHYIVGSHLNVHVLYIIIFLTFSFSILSYFILEQPIRKNKLNFKQSIIYLYLIPSICLIAFNLSMKKTITDRTYKLENISGYHVEANKLPVKIAVIGDSHSWHLEEFLNYVGNKEGWHAETVEFPMFCFLPDKDHQSIKGCDERSLNLLKDYPIVFVSFFYNLRRGINPIPRAVPSDFVVKDFTPRFQHFITQLAKDKKVFVFGDVKLASRSASRKILLDKMGMGKYLPPISEINNTQKTNLEIAMMIKDIPNVYYIDPTVYLPKNKFIVNGIPLYKDQDHLNSFGSYYMGKVFSENTRLLSTSEIESLYKTKPKKEN